MRKHKKAKKFLSMVLTMAMVWGILTVTAVAEEARSAAEVAEDEEGGSRGNCNNTHSQVAIGSRLLTDELREPFSEKVITQIYWRNHHVGVTKGCNKLTITKIAYVIVSIRQEVRSRSEKIDTLNRHRDAYIISSSTKTAGCTAGFHAVTGWVTVNNNGATFGGVVLSNNFGW